ncbi:hypothetical protein ABVT39_009473 [Epinephelus coioides]
MAASVEQNMELSSESEPEGDAETTLYPPNKKVKSVVWEFFGFVNKKQEKDEPPVCRRCLKKVPAPRANTSNLRAHLKEKHPDLFTEVMAQWSELELRIKIIKSCLPPATVRAESGSPVARYQSLLQRIRFHSPCQFVLGTLICSDGWGDAWKSRASQATHQCFLIGVPAVSSGRGVAATVPTSDSQNQKSDVPDHKRLLKNVSHSIHQLPN